MLFSSFKMARQVTFETKDLQEIDEPEEEVRIALLETRSDKNLDVDETSRLLSPNVEVEHENDIELQELKLSQVTEEEEEEEELQLVSTQEGSSNEQTNIAALKRIVVIPTTDAEGKKEGLQLVSTQRECLKVQPKPVIKPQRIVPAPKKGVKKPEPKETTTPDEGQRENMHENLPTWCCVCLFSLSATILFFFVFYHFSDDDD